MDSKVPKRNDGFQSGQVEFEVSYGSPVDSGFT